MIFFGVSFVSNPLAIGSLTCIVLLVTGKFSSLLYVFVSKSLLIASSFACILLVLAHQNIDSINDSSPINKPQSSNRDSIVVKGIQISVVVFLVCCVFINRSDQRLKQNLTTEIFEKASVN